VFFGCTVQKGERASRVRKSERISAGRERGGRKTIEAERKRKECRVIVQRKGKKCTHP